MNRTREDFCRILLDDHPQKALDPETLAARFVRYFDVPARPTMEQIKALLKRAGFGEVSGSRHMDAKGIHYSAPGGGYDIHYREDLWEGTQDYSVIHETYEIIYETLCDMESGSPPDRKGVHAGRTLRGGGPDAAEGLQAAGPGVGAGRTEVAARPSVAPMPPCPSGWPRCCATRPSWWSCTRGRTGETPKTGPIRLTSG